jgi:phage-related protein
MYTVEAHVRPNGDCPYSDYLAELKRAGAKKDIAKILAAVERLKKCGTQELVRIELAEKMNDVWQLRPQPHRIFFFFDSGRQRYILLHGYRKQSQKAPPQEIERAERLRVEYYRSDR